MQQNSNCLRHMFQVQIWNKKLGERRRRVMEYVIDCTEWNKEKMIEIFSALPEAAYTKIVLYTKGNEKTSEKSWEQIVGNYLNALGVPVHLKGYGYLKCGIIRCLYHDEELESVTKMLYPGIAEDCNTTSGKVEHGIRHAIQKAWEKPRSKEWEKIFGKRYADSNVKPTNSQFIATLYDFIKLNY